MNSVSTAFRNKGGLCRRSNDRRTLSVTAGLTLMVLVFGAAKALAQWPQMVRSADGTAISCEVHGNGEPTLVFVHGWNCDARYWRAQVPYFAKRHRLVILDLAGHGHSAATRTRYTMRAFGEDVCAVTTAAGAARVILIGHSMGGSVIAEAARLMPDRVVGLIGVDTLENIEYPVTREDADKMVVPFKKDFKAETRRFVGEMISPRTDGRLREWILADMSAAPPEVAIGAMEEMLKQYISGEAAKIFEQIRVPVISVNGDLWPVNYDANRRHMASYEAIVLKDADHFLMMNRPEAFNRSLDKAIRMLTDTR